MRLDTTADILSFIRKRREILITQGKTLGFTGLATASRNLVHTLENHDSVLAMDSQTDIAPEIDTTKMCAKFIVSTCCKDRHGDIVEPDGCLPHLKNYARNPRIFFAHRTDDLPIASARDAEGNLCLEVDKENGIIRSTAWFHGETPESELIFRLIARKELQAASIGFLPVRAAVIHTDNKEESNSEGDKIVDFRNMGHPIMHFIEWDMIEWSVVPIPANQEALAAHLGRGHIEGEKITPAVRKALAAWIPPVQKTVVHLSTLPITYVSPQGPTPGLESEFKQVTSEDFKKAAPSVDKEKLNEVYSKYKKETNMSYKELKAWSEHKCSKKASLSTGPIKRNLELLSTSKENWTEKHITWANKTIAFNSRMQKMPKGKPISKECPISKRDISLKNWAYDPNKSSKSIKELNEELINSKLNTASKEKKNPAAPPKDQITGSDKNKPNSASDNKGKIEISEATKKTLQNKIDKHNKNVKEKPAWAKTTLGAVKSVYRRGAGAFSSSHRPNMTRAQWAFARVNAFLKLCKNGKPENSKYISDNDLLHADHPKYSKEKKSNEDKDLDALIPPPKQPSDKKALHPSVNSSSVVGSKKEIGLKVNKEKKLFPDTKELQMAYEEDEDKKKKKKPSEEDEEVKEMDEDEEEKDMDEDDTDEEAAKAIDDEDEEDKGIDEEDKDAEEEDTTKILKGMSEVMNNMYDCAIAHTDILRSLHDKMDDMHKSKKAQEEEEQKNEEEEERKSILNALTTLKSNQDSLNKKLFELTGRK